MSPIATDNDNFLEACAKISYLVTFDTDDKDSCLLCLIDLLDLFGSPTGCNQRTNTVGGIIVYHNDK